MSRTPARVVQDMMATLATTLPGLSLEVGTPERKILDAAGEAISESYLDQYVTGTTLDIDTKAGLELEQFVGIFGFGRLQGRKATGIVRMEVSVAANQNIYMNSSTQFFAPNGGNAGAPLYFSSTQPAILAKDTYTVDIPIECTVAGSVGNVAPGMITSVSASSGATSVTNLAPLTGGIDIESDDQLRQRFKNTFLRNIAGTEDFYRALCLQNQFVSRVAVYGPTSMYRTQVAAPSAGQALPVHQDVKYVWEQSQSVFKDLAQKTEVFFTPGVDYTFTGGSAANLNRLAGGTMVAGEIVDVEFEYTTKSSRNNPLTGITNKVDVFVNGSDPYTVSEKTVMTNTLFSSSTSNELWTGNFVRVGTANTQPSTANRFMRLGSVPVVAFPSTLVVKNQSTSVTTTYTLGVHYHIVRATTLLAGSEREVSGIEWLSSGPANGTPLTLTYSYNRLPELVNALAKKSKQITTDVLIHEADYRYLRVHLDLEYNRGIAIDQVNANIQVALRAMFAQFNFGEWVEMSDIIMTAHQVIGVDNVWITKAADNPTNYGVKVYNTSNPATPLSTQTEDFKMSDNQLPIFLDAVLTRKANR
ncbi:baseplate wedge subunit [Rhodococcus phage Finch]|uniref:Baseplate J protein n=1 Tax=Rhodococcus phage Finch TaxID=2094144 RepID=A0A2P1JXD1_9CAUD|nr:baseplate wedge subunit [Rhodococcus phage Finch]AVO24996.1 baseplate J protein [Rhodococcus phage Finch]